MKKLLFLPLFAIQLTQISVAQSTSRSSSPVVKTVNGLVEGTVEQSGVFSFKGIPFAAPPVGDLRWKEPQPVKNWTGKLDAKQFGSHGMQTKVFGDMGFRTKGMSEDCLYLNVWTPSTTKKGLPVLVYFYGGGFVAGDGSEARYDGESMAAKGIVAVTLNYRLGVFGFMSHPELTKESPHKASGNYGVLDQAAALKWVQQNIAAFGGDPKRVTIAGESAGSVSVSAQMASPLSKNLIAGAIGESGSLLGTLPAAPLAKGEQTGVEFAKTVGANSLAELRALPADKLLQSAATFGPFRFAMTIDGYFFPKDPMEIYKAGEQAHVPLLAGWNSEEMNYRMVMGNEKPTKENYIKAVQKLYGEKANDALQAYNPSSDAEVEQVATDLASDRFISYSTWKWADIQAKTTGKKVYRYYFSRPRPAMSAAMGSVTAGLAGGIVKDTTAKQAPAAPAAKGAVHSAEIEYAMGNLGSNKVYDWTPDDYKVSKVMQEYFANFIKTADPNGQGLPKWPALNTSSNQQFMRIDVNTSAETDKNQGRYIFMEKAASK
ncbi:carboxylesterase family protein [Segetibacter sp.]|jgi:para-nitrobenzyl esterase|uniref:carboxylesterase/lipase family protein n=1 Tax=Segetibacter sp. TaxID=2231182 RepID=UPI00261E31C4|nr:carboxylesterase family protein [Segetibacter sp.]MCW3082241.1 carboxylesterase family protein [Segetibacter sp.]